MKSKEVKDLEHSFELTFAVGNKTDLDRLVDVLYEAGFNDALIGTGVVGQIGLMITRCGKDKELLIKEAIDQFMVAVPQAVLVGRSI